MNLVKMQHKAKTKGKGARSDIPSAGASLEHDERTAGDRQRGNDSIDPARTNQNYDLAAQLRERLYGGASAAEVYRDKYTSACDKFKKDTGKSLRADAVTLMSWVVTAPKDLPEEYHDEFFKGAYEWLVGRYGEENVIAANVHKDETQNHMHFKFMPFVPDEEHGGVKLCAKGLETAASMKKIHPALQKVLTKRLGVEVNLLNGATEHGNKTIIEMKIETLLSRLSELQTDIENGAAGKETLLGEINRLKVELIEYQAMHEAIDQRPPERPEPYIPERPYVGQSKSDFRKEVKAAEKDHKAWEKENKARAKWDKEHPEGYQKYTAGAVLAARAQNERERENAENAIAARERAISERERAVAAAEYEQQIAPIVARNAVMRMLRHNGTALELPTYGIQHQMQEHHHSAPRRAEMAKSRTNSEKNQTKNVTESKGNYHER